MSLTCVNLGAWGGVGAALFEGTWYAFAWAASACASGVSAQSYHFLAFSRFGAPLMMLMEPISYPVPSQGATTFTRAPSVATVTMSCMNGIPSRVSPRATAWACAAPDFVYS